MAAKDKYAGAYNPTPGSLLGPLTRVNVGPFVDGTDLPFKPRALHVSIAGNVKYVIGGVTNTEALEIGWHPIRPDQIFTTGTTATLTAWD